MFSGFFGGFGAKRVRKEKRHPALREDRVAGEAKRRAREAFARADATGSQAPLLSGELGN